MSVRSAILIFALSALLVLAWPGPSRVSAHPLAQGALTVDVFRDHIHVQARLTLEEVTVSANMMVNDDDLYTNFGDVFRRHGEYFLKHFYLRADGKRLTGKIASVAEPEESKAPVSP